MADSENKNEVVDKNQPKQPEQQPQQQQQQQNEEEKQKNKFKELIPTIARMLFFFFVYRYIAGMAQKKINQQNNVNSQFTGDNKVNQNNKNAVNQQEDYYIIKNIWNANDDTKIDFYAYLSENEIFRDFYNEEKLLWKIDGIKFKDWKENYTKDFEIELPESVLNNGTYYVHAYFTLSGNSPDPKNPKFNKKKFAYNKKCIEKQL